MADDFQKLINLDRLTVYNNCIQGWVNDKFYVGTKEQIIADFDKMQEGTYIMCTNDEIKLSQLGDVEPSEDDVTALFDEGN